MTTLVTGGNGWVPSHVLRRLAARGESVVSFDLSEPDALLLDFLGPHTDRVSFEQGDIVDCARLEEICRRHQVDAIIHAAVITPRVDREQREPERIIDVNLMGTVNVLEVARRLPGLRRLVYVSSGAVWGEQATGVDVLDEESPANAQSLYGVTKLASERLTLRYGALFDLDVAAVRPANVYGPMERVTPGYHGATELREMLRLWAAGEEVRVNSDAGPWLDWTYVEDIAEGIELVWSAPVLPRRVYSVTSGRLYSIGDVLRQFARHLPGFRWRVVDPAEANYVVSGDAPGPVPSNRRIREDFGWMPPTSLDDGMAAYLAWIRANGPQ